MILKKRYTGKCLTINDLFYLKISCFLELSEFNRFYFMKNFHVFKIFTCCLILCFLGSFQLNAQSQNTSIAIDNASDAQFSLFELIPQPSDIHTKDYVSNATYLRLSTEKLSRIVATHPERLTISIPMKNGPTIKLNLKTEQVVADDFIVTTSENRIVDYTPGAYYAGQVNQEGKSLAAISFFSDMVMGVWSFEGENYVLAHLNQDVFPAGQEYILYKESDLQIQNTFTCDTDDIKLETMQNDAHSDDAKSSIAKVVKVYFEGDYRLYLDKNSSANNVTNYITGLYNVVRTLYQNESIDTEISEIFVWTNNDPYPTNDSGAALDAFQNRLNGSYNGDLAHLVSSVNSNNGGIAYVDALCAPVYGIAYSNIGNSYSNFPTYSWTVGVVTHEMGHNLGSPHTQSCSWNGGALDDCYPTEGSCSAGPTPSNGGTIMSYCHLTSTGINFNNGFGTQPGNLIRSRVAAASCLGEGSGDGGNGGGGSTGTPNLTANSGNLNVNGNTITIVQTIANAGDGASANSTIGYWLSPDANFSASADYFIGAVNVPSIAANSNSGNLNFSKDVSTEGVPDGIYYVVYFIDHENAVSESNENDNLFYWSSPQVTVTNTTGGGGTGSYCDSSGGDASYEWISRVQIGSINKTSGSDGGYADYTNSSTNLEQGSTNNISLRTSYSGDTYSEYWRIWIDFNKDNDFDDAGEMVYESGTLRTNTVNDVLDIPAGAQLGATRMRVSMKWYEEDNTKQSSCSIFGYGEVEDYTVNIIENTGNGNACSISSLTAGEQTDCNPTSNTYEQIINVAYTCVGTVEIGVTVDGTYLGSIDATASPASIRLTGLDANGAPVKIKVEVCETGQSSCPELVENALFTAPDACDAAQGEPCVSYPSQREAQNITATTASLVWTAAEGARYYKVRVRRRLSNSWSSWSYLPNHYSNVMNLTNLVAGSRYQFRVRTRCPQGWTSWSPSTNFYMLNGQPNIISPIINMDSNLSFAMPNLNSSEEKAKLEIHVFPNPVEGELNLSIPAELSEAIMIFDVNGKMIQEVAAHEGTQVINTSTWQPGIYFIRSVQNGDLITKRFVKVK